MQDGQDEIKLIQAKDVQIVFLLKPSLILAAIWITGVSAAKWVYQTLLDAYGDSAPSSLNFRLVSKV